LHILLQRRQFHRCAPTGRGECLPQGAYFFWRSDEFLLKYRLPRLASICSGEYFSRQGKGHRHPQHSVEQTYQQNHSSRIEKLRRSVFWAICWTTTQRTLLQCFQIRSEPHFLLLGATRSCHLHS